MKVARFQHRSTATRNRLRSEGGFFLLFACITFLALLLMVALALEIGRLLIAGKQLQNAADAAALAGVQRLKSCAAATPNGTPLDDSVMCPSTPGNKETDNNRGGWQAVKPAILATLSDVRVLGRALPQLEFPQDAVNVCDFNGVWTVPDPDRMISGPTAIPLGGGTTVSVTVERKFECWDGTSVQFLPLDTPPPAIGTLVPYCFANAVDVTLVYRDISLPLAKLFGLVNKAQMTRHAVASVRQPNRCGPSIHLCTSLNGFGAGSCPDYDGPIEGDCKATGP